MIGLRSPPENTGAGLLKGGGVSRSWRSYSAGHGEGHAGTGLAMGFRHKGCSEWGRPCLAGPRGVHALASQRPETFLMIPSSCL